MNENVPAPGPVLLPTRSDAPSPFMRRLRWAFFGDNGLRAGWRLALFALLVFVLASAARFVGKLFSPGPRSPGAGLDPHSIFISRLITFAIIAVATAIVAKFERRRFGDFGLPLRKAFGRMFWVGAVWGFGALSFLLLLLHLFHSLDFGTLALTGAPAVRYGAEWLAAFLMVGFFEEFLFRGYVLKTLASGIRFWPAAIVLSLLFGYVHSGNPGETFIGLAAVVAVGLFFCFTVYLTGNLWWAVGFHMAFDWAETYFYGVPDSGMIATGHLLNSQLHGNKWISGGTVGPEGSALVFIVIAVLALLFAWVYRRVPRYSEGSTTAGL